VSWEIFPAHLFYEKKEMRILADNAKLIWDYFTSKGFSKEGIAGIMGNLYAESGLKSNNLQDAYNKILKMTDEQYTEAVDKNTYKKFTSDGAGYGIAQWTYSSLKKELYDLCKSKSTSISDIDSQLECLYNQLNRKGLLDKIKNATSIEEASDIFLTQFEKPQD